MTTLVLGANHLVGRYLLPRLSTCAALAPVIAVSRQPPRYEHPNISWLQPDPDDPASLLRSIREPITLVWLAPLWTLADWLSSLSDQITLVRIVAFGSTSVFTKETSGNSAERDVAARLAAGETALTRFASQHGIAYTLLRPTLIYDGQNDSNVARIAATLDRVPFFPLSSQGRGLRSPVHADDLAGAVIEALASPATCNKDYNLIGGETLSYRAMVARIAQCIGRKARFIELPDWSLSLVDLAGRLPPFKHVSAALFRRMADDLIFDDSAARRDFGWNPRSFEPKPCSGKK